MIGTRVSHYLIVGKLGEGGMGVVYKAHDTHLDRFVAIKVLSPGRVSDESSKARFIREAKAASALHHPNIVVVHDVSSEGGTNFIAMEYIRGETLAQMIPSEGMPLDHALKIAVQIADALAHAHSGGIIHRDLKPSNVMVNPLGHVKVLDFGLSKLAGWKSRGADADATAGLKTDEATIIGTATYMSPEQAEGKPSDERSDIFSFGGVLYEMISGQRAFQGDTTMSILASVIHSQPKALNGASPQIERIVHRCLTKAPAERYQKMAEVRDALNEAYDEWRSGVVSARRPGRRRKLFWLAGTAAILAAAAGLWLYSRAARPGFESPASVRLLTSYRGDEMFPCFSPDGTRVAFVWSGERQDNPDIYVKAVGTDKPVRLTTDPRSEVSPAWSPDGRYIAFLRQLEPQKVGCYLVPAAGGAERKLGELSGQVSIVFRGLAWLSDSARLVVGVMASASWHTRGTQGLRLLSIDSATQETWTHPEGVRGQDVSPSVSPDGRQVAFARVIDFDRSELFVIDVPAPGAKPGPPKRVGLRRPGADPLWTRDGRELIFTADFSGQPSFWRAALSKPGDARQIQATGVNVLQPALSWSSNRLAYATSFLPRPDLWRVFLSAPEVAAGVPEIIAASSQVDQNPSYSPDGRLIVFESSRSGTAEIWIADKEGQNPLQITSLQTRPNSPVWSPDGRQIAFRCEVEGTDQVCAASTLGGAVRMLTRNPAQNRAEAWTSDGRWVVFNSTRNGRAQTWRVPAAGGEAEFVAEGDAGRLSPDGKTRFRVDPANWITAEPTGGGPAERVAGPLSMMGNWALTPGGIYFIPRVADNRYTLMYYDLRTRVVKEVVRLTGTPSWGMDVSPDGLSVLFTASENTPNGSDLMIAERFP